MAVNMCEATGIRYGVIPHHAVGAAWYESSEAKYPEDAPEDAEVAHFELDDEGIKALQGGDSTDIFIIDSPYYTLARLCSPCAPNACYLLNPDRELGLKAYCFGHDWFEGGKAPYPVFRVDNDEEV